MPTSNPERLDQLLASLGTEIVLARAGSADGQFPILDLLGNLRDAAAAQASLAAFHECAKAAWEKLLGVVESGQPFTAEQLSWLQELCARLQQIADGPAPAAVPTAAPASPAAAAPEAKPPTADAEKQETPLLLNLDTDADLLREFVQESREHLHHIEHGVVVLEQQPGDADTLNTIFRAFHTFKGGAGFLNLVPINRLAHVLESLLDQARQHQLAITPPVIDLILKGRDTLQTFVNEIDAQLAGQKPNAPCLIPTEDLKGQVRAMIENPAAAVTTILPLEAASAQSDSIGFRQESEESKSTIPFLPESDGKSGSVPPDSSGFKKESPIPFLPESDGKSSGPSAPSKASDAGASSNRAAASVKVDTQKLDAMVDMVGELVIAQSLVAQNLSQLSDVNPQFARNLAQVGRITRELQRVSLALRMVPIRGAFQKMARVVRDLAAKQQKQVQFATEGDDTELDRNVVEALADPLLHLIRNAVDHGIEFAAARAAQGKPGAGTIRLRAYHQAGNIVIEIQDDGAGLRRDRILAKAAQKGLVAANVPLTDAEVFEFIFAPGFSTAENVTDVSGRGVGLDVVRRNVETLRGCVEVISEPGRGSTFKLMLPLTLAIIDGLVLQVGEERYILPTLSVRESFRPAQDMITTVQGRGEVINVRGRLIPLLRLHELFGIASACTNPTEGIVLVAQAGATLRGLLVDRLLSKQEVVIKSLGELLQRRNPVLAGAAILGDGRVGLILDANALVNLQAAAIRKAA